MATCGNQAGPPLRGVVLGMNIYICLISQIGLAALKTLVMQSFKRINNGELRGCVLKPAGNVDKRVK